MRGRLSPTSILPHKWGRKMLQPANSVTACGSVSFPRQNGGRPGWGAARRGSRLSPTSVLPHTWGRKMLQHANSVSACASTLPACGSVSFPRLRGKAGMGDSQHCLRHKLRIQPAKIKPVYRLTLSPDASPAAPDNNPHWHNAVLRDYPKLRHRLAASASAPETQV